MQVYDSPTFLQSIASRQKFEKPRFMRIFEKVKEPFESAVVARYTLPPESSETEAYGAMMPERERENSPILAETLTPWLVGALEELANTDMQVPDRLRVTRERISRARLIPLIKPWKRY